MLLRPVERQIEFSQTGRRKLVGLPTIYDRLDQLWAQERKIDQAPDIASRLPTAPPAMTRTPARKAGFSTAARSFPR